MLYSNTTYCTSQYHIHLPYKAECDDAYNDNFTNSTTTHPITNTPQVHAQHTLPPYNSYLLHIGSIHMHGI